MIFVIPLNFEDQRTKDNSMNHQRTLTRERTFFQMSELTQNFLPLKSSVPVETKLLFLGNVSNIFFLLI